jgi:hypothetical protein
LSTCSRVASSRRMRSSTMSSNGFLLSLDIDRRACRRVSAVVFSVALLALVTASLSDLACKVRTVIATATLACGLWESWRTWPGSRCYVTRIHLSGAGNFLLGRAGEPQVLAPASLIHWWVLPGFAVGLAFMGRSGQRGQAILFRDQLPPSVWRRLQVRLRHGVEPDSCPNSA